MSLNTGFFKTDGSKKRDLLYAAFIINLLAIIHAITCLTLRYYNISDGLFLTILTILMIALLVQFFKGTTEIFLALALLSCLSGFYMGTIGADLISKFINNDLLAHVFTTILITEIIGWLIFVILKKSTKSK